MCNDELGKMVVTGIVIIAVLGISVYGTIKFRDNHWLNIVCGSKICIILIEFIRKLLG